MPVLKEEFLSIKISRLIRDEDLFPTTTVMVNDSIADDIAYFARSAAIYYLNPADPNDVTVTRTIST